MLLTISRSHVKPKEELQRSWEKTHFGGSLLFKRKVDITYWQNYSHLSHRLASLSSNKQDVIPIVHHLGELSNVEYIAPYSYRKIWKPYINAAKSNLSKILFFPCPNIQNYPLFRNDHLQSRSLSEMSILRRWIQSYVCRTIVDTCFLFLVISSGRGNGNAIYY